VAKQLGNTMNASVRGSNAAGEMDAPASVTVEAPAGETPPVRELNVGVLRNLGAKYKGVFDRYSAERLPLEQRWLKNLRQYMGIYDPDIERQLDANRSKAYPRITRVKCIAMVSRLMNLMFPGNEDNWELNASPSPSMSPENIKKAVDEIIAERQALNPEGQVQITTELVAEAARRLAEKQAKQLTALIKDQLHELGGSQLLDWISLNRKVIESGVRYGVGVLEGPFVRTIEESGWGVAEDGVTFTPTTRVIYKPAYDFVSCWDFYPDMSAKKLPGEGYFLRKVLGRSALRKLGKNPFFFERQIRECLTNMPNGNYKAKSWENELKSMGTAIQTQTASSQSSAREKYEVIVWKGPVSAQTLKEAGADVPDEFLADDVDAELWLVDNYVIRAQINPWRKLGVDVPTVHMFVFDEDDTSPVGQGLPYVVRDSQLSAAAATRMVLDNASVVCGPMLEVNTTLLRPDQDITSISPYKIWYRDDDGMTAQYPAVRSITVDGHINELQALINMFLEFADMETFIGPATGGDMSRAPSEPMRTAAGASMLRGDAALPFKDIVRNFDSFTQSVIWSLVQFNKKFNPDEAPEGDYDVIPRGATSLIAKEVRGMQIDQLGQSLTEDERDHIDERKMTEMKMAARDLQGVMVSEDVARSRKEARVAAAAEQAALNKEMLTTQIRVAASDAFKNITQGQKNAAAADANAVNVALDMLQQGTQDGSQTQGS
jgi:hypothetical protein